ncbi:hypothetical protein N7475_002659 [Penicillium sp. IBT 31633x]|nr:hypothetical protein N7475_002659 [Penicillium sp. IBT 31633x]
MKNFLVLLALSTIEVCAHGEEASTEMGPAAFMWPPDRLWGAAYDNNAPCGSSTGVVNRTKFSLINGKLALVIQDESWNVQVAISHKSNPTTNEDFESFIDSTSISEVNPGHECYSVPNPSIDVEEGMNATFQIKYTSDFDTDKNETYYACADVTYIAASKFTYQVPCFNVTSDEFTEMTTTAASGSTATAKPDTTKNSGTTSQKGSGLSGGAIAGIVVGSVAGLGLGIALLFFYRRLLQKYRFLRQRNSTRNVDWNNEALEHKVEDGTPIGLRKIR